MELNELRELLSQTGKPGPNPDIHCKCEAQGKFILDKGRDRMKDCNLELHPVKTKIVYCQDKDRREQYVCTQFDFLGYTYQRALIKDRTGRLWFNFLASSRKNATKSLNASIRAMEIHRQTGAKIEIIAEMINPIVRGWMNDFGCYNRRKKLDCVQRRLIRWAMCKFKNFRAHRQRAERWLNEIKKREPDMFAHWALSRVNDKL